MLPLILKISAFISTLLPLTITYTKSVFPTKDLTFSISYTVATEFFLLND